MRSLLIAGTSKMHSASRMPPARPSPKVATCADSVRIAEFEKSVESFVSQELPKFVKLEGQA